MAGIKRSTRSSTALTKQKRVEKPQILNIWNATLKREKSRPIVRGRINRRSGRNRSSGDGKAKKLTAKESSRRGCVSRANKPRGVARTFFCRTPRAALNSDCAGRAAPRFCSSLRRQFMQSDPRVLSAYL